MERTMTESSQISERKKTRLKTFLSQPVAFVTSLSPPVFLLPAARGEEVTYLPVCSPEALPELQCPNPGLQSAQQHTHTHSQ